MTRNEILQAIQAQHAELNTVLATLPTAQLQQPLVAWWNAKDLLGHIALWEQVALKFIREYKHEGVPKQLGIKDDDDLDRYNKRGVAIRRDLPFDVVRAELDATYHDLIAEIESLSDADLRRPLPEPWGEGATLERLIAVNAYQHVPEHIEQITALKRGSV